MTDALSHLAGYAVFGFLLVLIGVSFALKGIRALAYAEPNSTANIFGVFGIFAGVAFIALQAAYNTAESHIEWVTIALGNEWVLPWYAMVVTMTAGAAVFLLVYAVFTSNKASSAG